ncbi:iron-containing alcohol dehydrogenase [Algihabitans albus]|uniref:iron-containing alcohol dehydrogenase n=1 Tax=Algihabitans albus TaxID=2164067 RepID=UPI000E5D76BE|nr:iron-containing alcohol dehydrogenase [Algihabitans albus]
MSAEAPQPIRAAPNKADHLQPAGGWTALIDDFVAGRWISPLTGLPAPRPATQSLAISESLNGCEAELVGALGVDGRLAVVADENTWEALGRRVAVALGADDRAVVLGPRPHADLPSAEALKDKLTEVEHVVAVGSGTINDLCKYVTAQDGRSCSVFATAASMDGYTSSTASMALPSGLKISLPAHAPKGAFFDLEVIAAAPPRMAAAGFGDCLCSSVARIDWWMSHRLLDSFFMEEPYLVAAENDKEMAARVEGIGRGEVEAVGYLVRALVLSGLGVALTKVSNHGSMGEHQISHYIDCFAGKRHPGTLHGQQVGVASLTMARIQAEILCRDRPPELAPTRIDESDMARRMGLSIATECAREYRKKALDADAVEAFNRRLAELWPSLRAECLAVSVPVTQMKAELEAAGGATTAAELGLDPAFYREAVRHAHEMRNRFSFADIACDAGLLDDLAAAEG